MVVLLTVLLSPLDHHLLFIDNKFFSPMLVEPVLKYPVFWIFPDQTTEIAGGMDIIEKKPV
jgi:hypothetical protein